MSPKGNQSIAEEEKRTLEEEVRSLRQKTETYVRDADGDKQNLEQELHNLRQTTETQVREYSNLEESLKNVRTSVSEKDSHLQVSNSCQPSSCCTWYLAFCLVDAQ